MGEAVELGLVGVAEVDLGAKGQKKNVTNIKKVPRNVAWKNHMY